MHSFEVHSNESACRKSGSFGLEQVNGGLKTFTNIAPLKPIPLNININEDYTEIIILKDVEYITGVHIKTDSHKGRAINV